MAESPRISNVSTNDASTNDASFYSLTPLSSPTPLVPSTSPSASPRQIPTVPSPSATVQEVQCFFRDCFLAFRPLLDQEEAEMEAKKLMIDGVGLYTFSAEVFRDEFGPAGRAIYDIVDNGYYRYAKSFWPFLRFLQKVFVAVAAGNGIYQFWKDPKEKKLAVTYVFAAITTFVSFVYQFTSTGWVIESKIWPEKFKVRNPAEAAAATPRTPW